jgi:hypothetical protein
VNSWREWVIAAPVPLIYLHSTDERQREIADSLNQLAKDQLKRARRNAARHRSGTQRARKQKGAS